jgi:hypothetical protein
MAEEKNFYERHGYLVEFKPPHRASECCGTCSAHADDVNAAPAEGDTRPAQVFCRLAPPSVVVLVEEGKPKMQRDGNFRREITSRLSTQFPLMHRTRGWCRQWRCFECDKQPCECAKISYA